MKPIVIVGSGSAGNLLAKAIRTLSDQEKVIIITRDNGDYYYKPSLSTAFQQKKQVESLILSSAEAFSKKYSIEFLTHCEAQNIDVHQNIITAQHEKIAYKQLVLACGAMPRQCIEKSFNMPKVYSINNLWDFIKFKEQVHSKKKIVILGSGLIGCEFANDLVKSDFEVTVISRDNYPLQNFIDKTTGEKLKAALAVFGVQWHLGVELEAIQQQSNQIKISLNNNVTIEAETILSAIGLEPNVTLAKAAGININRGIITDDFLKTNISNIYGIGDCAEINGRIYPFIEPIRRSADVLAKTLLGFPAKVDLSCLSVKVKTPDFPLSFAID